MLCSILLVTGITTIFYLAYSFFLKPWLSLKYYKNQGCEMTFFPLLGNFKACQDTLESQGDFYGHIKNILKRNPKVKAIGGNLMSSPHVFLTDPNVITEFYKLQDKHYVKSATGIDLFKLLNGEGLGINDGEVWKRHRKVISQTFHFEFLKSIIPLISSLSNEMLDEWKNKDLEDFELMRGLGDITGEVIGRAFFGTKFGEYRVCGKSLKHLITDVNGRLGAELLSPWYLMFGGKAIEYGIIPRYKQLMKDIGELRVFAKQIVEERRKVLKEAQEEGKPSDSNTADLLDSLLTASGFTDQEIIDEFITFTTAGMESTGRVIGNAIYNLAKNPQHKERLLEEANQHLKNPSQITIDNLNQMDFMNCVLKETLRFSIPDAVLIDRIATEDHVLHDLKIKKGTLVSISLEANMFNPDYYENADDFDPYRWIGDTKTKKAIAANPRVYLPFSAGGHTCIGQHLAMNEAKVIIGMFLQKFDFKLSPTYEHKMTVRMLYEPLNRMGFKLIPK